MSAKRKKYKALEISWTELYILMYFSQFKLISVLSPCIEYMLQDERKDASRAT